MIIFPCSLLLAAHFQCAGQRCIGRDRFQRIRLGVWNLCSLNRNGLALFCFMLFDEDNLASLSLKSGGLGDSSLWSEAGSSGALSENYALSDPDGDNTVNKADF